METEFTSGLTFLQSKFVFVDSCSSKIEDYYLIEAVSKMVALWGDEQIFSKNFCELLQSYLRPKLDMTRQKVQAQMTNNFYNKESAEEVAAKRLQKQLKVINMFDEPREAVRLELNIRKLDAAKTLKTLSE